MSSAARRLLIAVVLAAGFLGNSGTAHAYLYFAGQGRIGRATNDGAVVEPEFIQVAGFTCGVAVDAQHVYWANVGSGPIPPSIGRANLDGTGVEPAFISLPGTDPCGVAVTATHLYWTDMTGYVGKADIGGANVTPHWAEAAEACGIAANEEFLYVAHGGGGSFGLVELAESGISEGQVVSQIETTGRCGVSLDPPYVYWANGGPSSSGTSIGRAETNFLFGHDDSWLTTTADPNARPWSVAVHDGQLYYAPYAGPIGRFRTDGSQPLQSSFVPSGGDVVGIAVDDLPAPVPPAPAPPGPAPAGAPSPGSALKLIRTKARAADGTAALAVRVSGPGSLVLFGKDVKTERVVAKAAGKVDLTVRAKGAARRALHLHGHVRVSFTPKNGSATSTRSSVRLVQR